MFSFNKTFHFFGENFFTFLQSSASFTLLFVVGFGIGLFVYRYYTQNDYWKARGIKYVNALPIFGSYLPVALMRKSEGELINDIYKEYKGEKVVGYFKLKCQPGLIIRDPGIIHKVLVKDFHHFANNDFETEDPILKHNLTLQKDEVWKKNRAVLTPAFSSGKVHGFYPQIASVAEELVEYLKNQPEEIHAEEVFKRYTEEVTARCVFSIDGKSFTDQDPIMKKIGKILFPEGRFNATTFLLINEMPWLQKLFNIRLVPEGAVNIFLSLINDVMTHRKKRQGTYHDFIQYLEDLKNQASGYSDDEIIAGCVTFFFEAHETITTVISHVLYNLALNENVQKKSRQEIQQAFERNKREWTFEAVLELPYLDSIILETHRKFPVSFGLKKLCTERYEMDIGKDKPLVVEKGTSIWIPTYGIHNDDLYWDDVETFKPERFFHHEQITAKTKGIFLPFGDGPRMCIGVRIAQLIIKAALVHILQNFKIEPSNRTPKNVVLDPSDFMLKVKNGIYFNLVRNNLC